MNSYIDVDAFSRWPDFEEERIKTEEELKKQMVIDGYKTQCKETANQLKIMYDSLVEVGFTEEQSFKIVFNSLPKSK